MHCILFTTFIKNYVGQWDNLYHIMNVCDDSFEWVFETICVIFAKYILSRWITCTTIHFFSIEDIFGVLDIVTSGTRAWKNHTEKLKNCSTTSTADWKFLPSPLTKSELVPIRSTEPMCLLKTPEHIIEELSSFRF